MSSSRAKWLMDELNYFIIFLDFLSPSSFIPPQNVMYFLMLSLLHKIFTFYINGVLNCKCSAKGLMDELNYFIIFLDFLSPSSFIPPQNVVYFLMLSFLFHKIFTFYINGVLNCKCSAKGLMDELNYFIIFLDFLSPSPFIPPQNAVYFLMLSFLFHKIFTFYINGVLNCKCSAKGLIDYLMLTQLPYITFRGVAF